ncbi:MAG TPA: FAD-dependent oxidoreductase [Candidatus Angelobacter sp.]|nr:FAD-dependent oxidoreductase [Candidatus Angelobacter sp.]
MSTDTGIVIVGGGLAAAKAAEAVRAAQFDGPVTVLGEERHHPYERPPLSKGYLQGSAERDSVFVHPASWYAEHGVDLRLGTAVAALDRAGRRVVLADGASVGYRRLLIATGSSPRPIGVPGEDLAGVHRLRRIEDCEEIRAAFAAAAHVVVVGAGWIGLETAAAARLAGVADVTILESASAPLLRVLGPEVADVFVDLHREHGVEMRFDVRVTGFTGRDGVVTGVDLADGSHLNADVVVVGVGITPNVELARDAGLEVDDGIVVDEHLRTSDPDVFAAGDVANAWNPTLGRRIRVEHWANAVNQPVVAAAGLVGREAVYERLPYFYSDQYDLGLEYLGLAAQGEYDRVVIRGDRPGRELIAFWLSGGRVLAGMNVNVWDVTEPIRGLITSRRQVDVDRLADPSIPLEEV